MSYVGEQTDERTIYIFPFIYTGTNDYELIEDDGISMDYSQGHYAKIKIHLITSLEEIKITIIIEEDKYLLPYDKITLKLPSRELRKINITDGVHHLDENNSNIITIDNRLQIYEYTFKRQ